VRLCNLASGTFLDRFGQHHSSVSMLVFSPDGRLLASAAEMEGPFTLWEVATMSKIVTFDAVPHQIKCLAFAPDGRLATTSLDGLIRLYGRDFALPPLALRAPGADDKPVGVAFSRDGKTLVWTNLNADGNSGHQVWDRIELPRR
jgi:WD40 repeat protein